MNLMNGLQQNCCLTGILSNYKFPFNRMDWYEALFSRHCIVAQEFVKEDYVDHLAQIEMRKEKRRAESERQQTQGLEQDYNDIE